jgi:hypothetical protein
MTIKTTVFILAVPYEAKHSPTVRSGNSHPWYSFHPCVLKTRVYTQMLHL